MHEHKGISRCILTGFVLLILMVTGCEVRDERAGMAEGYDGEVFIADEVPRVIIYMKSHLWQHLVSRAKNKQYKPADLWFDDRLVSGVAVRAKGSSSLTYVVDDESDRISLKVDFDRLNNQLSFGGLKKLNFHNNYRDPSLMRERLAYEMFGQMGVPAPRATHVDLWVNGIHMGLYTQVEQVDKTFLERHFENSTGDLYKAGLSGSYLNWSGMQHNKLEDMELKTNDRISDHSALLHMLEVLNNEPSDTFPQEIEKVLDVDEVLRFIAVETSLVCLDSYLGRGLNYYLYESDGRFSIIPWDLNEAFGTYKCGLDKQEIIDFKIDEPICGPPADRPLVARLLEYEPYRETYHGYLEELIEGPFSAGSMSARIDEVADQIRSYVEADDMKFYTTEEFERNLSEDVGRYFGLKSFVEKRTESIRLQLAGELLSSNNGEGNQGAPDKP